MLQTTTGATNMGCIDAHAVVFLSSLAHILLVVPSAADCRPRISHHFFLVPPKASSAPPPPKPKSTAAPTPARSLPPILKTVCMRTTYPSICESSVEPYLPTTSDLNHTTSSSVVLLLLLKAARNKTVAAMDTFGKLAGNHKTERAVAEALSDCKSRYGDGVDNYDAAIAAVKVGDIKTAEINLSAVLDDYDACGGGDAPMDPTFPGVGPWTKYNEAFSKVADVCLELCAVLE